MRAEEIRDRETLEAWLKDQPREVAVMIAARAALRAFPSAVWIFRAAKRGSRTYRIETAHRYALMLQRCLLSVFVAQCKPCEPGKTAAALARAVLLEDEIANDDFGELYAAINAASAVQADNPNDSAIMAINYAGVRPRELAQEDARSVNSVASVQQIPMRPLWLEMAPEELRDDWDELRTTLEENSPDWQFWIDWYERVLRGDPQNWDMLTEIVLIPDADWQQGPRHVNAIIAGIVERYRGGGAGKRVEDLPPAAAARLQAQVAFLLQNATLAGANADVLATQIDAALSLFLNEVGLNDIPEVLKVFELMAQTLRGLAQSVVVARDDSGELAALRQQVVDLGEQLAALKAEVACIRREGSLGRFLGRAVLGGAAATAGAGIVGYAGWFVYHYAPPEMINALVRDIMRRQ